MKDNKGGNKMEVKKILSLLLVVCMVASIIVMPAISASAETVEPLANIVANGDMESGMDGFRKSPANATLSIVEDPGKDNVTGNHVLLLDATSDSSSAAILIYDTPGIVSGNKYAFSADIKILYCTDMGAKNRAMNNVAPFGWHQSADLISGNTWYTKKVTANASNDSTSGQFYINTNGAGSKGAKYYVDNIALYDITNAVNVTDTIGNGVTINYTSGAPLVNGQRMANKGSNVSFELDVDNGMIVKSVKANGETVTPQDGVYTFVAPETDFSVEVVTEGAPAAASLTNIVANGDMESGMDGFRKSPANATLSIVEDPGKDNVTGNHVLLLDATSDSSSAAILTYDTPGIVSGNKYAFSADIKILYCTDMGAKNRAMNNVAPFGWHQSADLISGNTWYTKKVTANATNDSTYGQFYINTNSAGSKGAKYYVDNLALYDITNAVNVTDTIGNGVTINYTSGAPLVNGQRMANKGSNVSFRLDVSDGIVVKSVKANGETVTPQGDVYSFVAPEADFAVEVETEGTADTTTSLKNIIINGDMESSTSGFSAASGISFSIVEDAGKGNVIGNHVLLMDGTGAATTGTILSYNTPGIVIGNKYAFSADVKLLYTADMGLKSRTINNMAPYGWKQNNDLLMRGDVWYTSEFIANATTDSSSGQFYIGQGSAALKGAKYYIDNLALYDVTNAYKIKTPGCVILTPNYFAKIGSNQFANANDTVKFTIDPVFADYVTSVKLNGEEITADNDVYSFKMPNADVEITAEISQQNKMVNLVENGDMSQANDKFAVDGEVTKSIVNGKLCIDATANTDVTNKSQVYYEMPFIGGNSYLIKLKTQCSQDTIDAVNNTGITSAIYFDKSGVSTTRWTDSILREQTYFVTMDSDESGINIAVNDNSTAKYYIDDLEIYNVTGVNKVSYAVKGGLINPQTTSGVLIDTRERCVYINTGDSLNFTFEPFAAIGKHIETSLAQDSDIYTYTAVVGDTVIPINSVDDISYAVNENKATVSSTLGESFSAIVAKYDDNGYLSSASVSTVDDASEIDIPTANKVKIFSWSSIDDMIPLRKIYNAVIPADANLYTAGDQTVKYLSGNSPNASWTTALSNEFLNGVSYGSDYDKSERQTTISDYVNSSAFEALKTNISAGDYVIVCFGINDAINNVTAQDYEEALRTIISALDNKGAKIIVVKEQRTNISDVNTKLSSYHLVIDEVASEFTVPVADLYSATNGMSEKCFDSADNTSLSFAGAQFVASKFAELLDSIGSDLCDYVK